MNGKWKPISIGILLFGMLACSPLEPIIVQPEISDLQLTVDTVTASLRDAQRTVAELRAEVEARRQEFANVQIARAQLEGNIREAERRLAEARQVIDLQREELANSRSERERVRRTRFTLQHRLEQAQKLVSKVGKRMKGSMSPATMASPIDEQLGLTAIGFQQDALSAASEKDILVVLRLKVPDETSVSEVEGGDQTAAAIPRIQLIVKSGDTLWNIARRYHTSVSRLMVRNALSSDRILVGQAIWLTEPAVGMAEHERM